MSYFQAAQRHHYDGCETKLASEVTAPLATFEVRRITAAKAGFGVPEAEELESAIRWNEV